MENGKKNVIWNIIGATVSAFNSLLFAIIVTRLNGVDEAGVFIYCFATACLFYVIAIYAGRAFQVTDITEKNSDTDYVYNRILTCIVMIIVSVLFCVIKGYDLYKASVLILLCIFKVVEAFSESIYAVLQKNELLYKVGKSLFLKAFIGLIVFLLADILTKNIIFSSILLIIVNIVILIIYDFKNLKGIKIIKTKYSNTSNWRLIKIGFYTFVLNFLAIYLINAPRYAIDDLLTNDLQTIFGIIIMPATFMGLLGQYIIQPMLTSISKNLKNQNYKELKQAISRILLLVLILGIIVFIVAYLLEVPVLKFVYGIELEQYKLSMMIIIFGSVLYSFGIILSTILISMRETFIQVVIYSICSIIATILSYNLIGKVQIFGASITYLITMGIVALCFIICVINRIKSYEKMKIGE